MKSQENKILCVEDKNDCSEIVIEQGQKLGVDVAINVYSAATLLVKEKRQYVCVILDAQFPLASMDVIMKDDHKDKMYRDLLQLDEEHRIQSEKEKFPPLGGVILIHFLVRREINLSGILWVLNSNTFNGQLYTALETAGVKKPQIKGVRDKYDITGFADIFRKINPQK